MLQDTTRHDVTRHHKAGCYKTPQGRMLQDTTRQDVTRHHKTGCYKTPQDRVLQERRATLSCCEQRPFRLRGMLFSILALTMVMQEVIKHKFARPGAVSLFIGKVKNILNKGWSNHSKKFLHQPKINQRANLNVLMSNFENVT